MAPLVPEIISTEFNFVIAFLVGIGFGFALEQAGFSSTKKLVGLFYGYDFTVLKVFFTAGVTAMTGVLVLSHLGMLDLERIFINPMFTWPAIVGGLIMGGGFIIGGFCPGTSICAASVGRLDAFSFIGGSILGILLFTEGFPYIEGLYTAGNMGAPTVPQALGISPELFGFLLALVAITAFVITSRIEDWVNGLRPAPIPQVRQLKYAVTAGAPMLIILAVWLTPDSEQRTWNKVDADMDRAADMVRLIDADKLAFELMYNAHEYNVIDVRDSAQVTVPTAIHVPLNQMDDTAWKHLFAQQYKQNIFVASSKEQVLKAGLLARQLGDADPLALNVGVGEFRKTIFESPIPGKNASKAEIDRFDFHVKAAKQLRKIEERLKNLQQPVKKKVVRAQGGCT